MAAADPVRITQTTRLCLLRVQGGSHSGCRSLSLLLCVNSNISLLGFIYQNFFYFKSWRTLVRSVGPLISGHVCPGFQSPRLQASLHVCNGFLRFTSGVTPADLSFMIT